MPWVESSMVSYKQQASSIWPDGCIEKDVLSYNVYIHDS